MRAVKLTIHNFRSIKHSELALGPYSLLVGANNAGKSNVIDAIRVFYEKEIKYDAGRDWPRFDVDDDVAWIELEFELSAAELATLADDYKNPAKPSMVSVRKYLRVPKDYERSAGVIYGYKAGGLATEPFYGAKNVQQAKCGDVIYIPAVNRLDDITKTSGPSAFRDLVASVMKKVVGSSQAFKDLEAAFGAFGGGIKAESVDGQSLEKLEQEITDEIKDWGTSFSIGISSLSSDELVKQLVNHHINDSLLGKGQESKSYGQGFQRHLIFTLIRLAAKYGATAAKGAKKDFNPSLTWLLFEEPEAFLHPSQIETQHRNLQKLASQDGHQVLITTHSPQFASKNMDDVSSLVRLHRYGAATQARQLSAAQAAQLRQDNLSDMPAWQAAGLPIDPDDLKVEMESVKYALWLDSTRSSAFFAKKVLIVEGPTERAILGKLVDDGLINDPEGGLFILDAMGKYNFHRFMALLGALGIKHAALYDLDNVTDAKHAAVNATIAAHSNSATIGLDHFPKDIESFLAVPSVTNKGKHRKPQHLMYHLQQGLIAPAKLQLLADKVNTLLSPPT